MDKPNTSEEPIKMAAASRTLRIEQLATQAYQRRRDEKLTLEVVSQATGISMATLSRFEQWRHGEDPGKPMPEPEAKTLIAVSRWLGVSLDSILADRTSEVLTRIGDKTPDVVEAYLRADRKLSPQAAQALNTLFRTAYEQIAQQQRENKREDE